MESNAGRVIAEIAFYVAIAVLLVLFFVKKYRQAKNVEKDNLNNKP